MTRRHLASAILFSTALLTVTLSIAPTPAQAETDHPLPKHVCDYGACSTQQQEIWNRFQTYESAQPEIAGRLYSGHCYHKSPNYDGAYEHFGVAYFDTSGEAVHFDGKFAFFAQSNPFINWSVEDAEKELQPKHEMNSVLHFEEAPEATWADFNEGSTPITQYYFRQSTDTKKIAFVGFWGVKHLMLCEFSEN